MSEPQLNIPSLKSHPMTPIDPVDRERVRSIFDPRQYVIHNQADRTPLCERSRRKPEFLDGFKVRLANSELWSIPAPGVTVKRFHVAKGGDVSLKSSHARHAEEWLPALTAEMLAATGDDQIANAMFLVSIRLLTNYKLDAEDLSELLPVVLNPDGTHELTNRSLWANLIFAVCGVEDFAFSL